MIFQQIKHMGDNFSYIIANESSRDAIVVDPSFNSNVIERTLRDQNLRLRYIVNTHSHGDHTVGNEDLKSIFGVKLVVHRLSPTPKDIGVVDGDVIKLGKIVMRVIHTPGHSPDGICLLVDKKLLTGDTLFVGECGRTDMFGGSPEDMFHSLFDKLLKLDDDVAVFPGHDYGPSPSSTIGRERETNYTLKDRTIEEFVEFMKTP